MSEPVKESVFDSPPVRTGRLGGTSMLSFARHELLYLALPLLLVLFFFWKTIFLGQAISNLDLLNQLDLIFNPDLKASSLSVTIDPTACLHMVPYQVFADRTLFNHVIPLWNDLTGCGRPFAADIASPSWAPLNLLFKADNPYFYNLGIVIKLAFGVIGAYILSRVIGISRYSSAVTASAYFFCPRALHLFELGGNTYFYPWILLGFIWLSKAPNFARAALLGIFVAFIFYSMHPEIFFVIIASGVVITLASLWQNKNETKSKTQQFLNIIGAITTTGIISLLLAAPLILPFLEYLKNGSCYKYSDTSCIFVSVQEYLINAFRPTMPASIFMGSTIALLLPAGLLAAFKQKSPFLILLPFLFIFSTRPPGFEQFLANPPWSYLLPEYTLQPLILVFALIAGMGMDLFCNKKNSPSAATTILLISTCLWIAFLHLAPCFLAIQTLFGINLDGLGAPGNNSKVFLPIALIFITGILVRYGLRRSTLITSFITVILIVLNFASIYKLSLAEMKPRPSFSLDASEPIHFLQNFQRRIIATGDRTFLANVHMIYGIQDLRSMGPLSPNRFPEFMKAAGAQRGEFNAFKFSLSPSRLLDLASVGFILSPCPLIDPSTNSSSALTTNFKPGSIAPGLRILQTSLRFDSEDRSVTGNLLIRAHGNISRRYEAQPVLLEKNGTERGAAIATFLDAEQPGVSAHRIHIPVSIAVPAGQPAKNFYVAIRFKDLWTGHYVKPGETQEQFIGDNFLLAQLPTEIQPTKDDSHSNKRFKLRYESASGMRIYENTKALPPAYLAHRQVITNGPEEALAAMQKIGFAAQNDVVLDKQDLSENHSGQNQHPTVVSELSGPSNDDQAVVTRDSPSKISIKSHSQFPSWLVLTDTFYPGWKATLDGQTTPIIRANYLFRAIKLPAGNHDVTFIYDPDSFRIGLLLAALGIILVVICSVPQARKIFNRRRTATKSL